MYLFCSKGQYNLHAEDRGHEMNKASYKFYRLHMLHVNCYPDCLIIIHLSNCLSEMKDDDCYALF